MPQGRLLPAGTCIYLGNPRLACTSTLNDATAAAAPPGTAWPLSTGRPKGHPVYVALLGEAEVESGSLSPGSSPSDEGRPDAGVDAGSSGQQPNVNASSYTPCSGSRPNDRVPARSLGKAGDAGDQVGRGFTSDGQLATARRAASMAAGSWSTWPSPTRSRAARLAPRLSRLSPCSSATRRTHVRPARTCGGWLQAGLLHTP